MENNNTICGDWVNYIDLDKLHPYSLQFANAMRIKNNDVVYLFDEVGSGKTISAGIMAMECLNNSEGNVLIISTPSVAGSSKNPRSQFKDDWDNAKDGKFKTVIYKKGWGNRIEITNNWYSNLEKKSNAKKYALVIVDEAHLFLCKGDDGIEKYMTQNLRAIKTEKVIFATATPIKDSIEDLRQYADIACSMLEEKKESVFIETQYKNLKSYLSPQKKNDKSSLICCKFDPYLNVTRYFKETVRKFERGNKVYNPIRHCAEKWPIEGYDNSIKSLIDIINEIVNKKQDDRFVIFTWFIIEANNIGKAFEEKGYRDFFQEKTEKTYAVITGDDSWKLSCCSGLQTGKVPDIIIMTSKIAEQGVNLPLYNYVVNYHISAFPSALEQRFGRVDRINSVYPKIHMVFWDTMNNINYYFARYLYARQLLADIPVRNVLLTSDDFKNISKTYDEIEKYRKKVEDIVGEIESDLSKWVKILNEGSDEYSEIVNILKGFGKYSRDEDDKVSEESLKTILITTKNHRPRTLTQTQRKEVSTRLNRMGEEFRKAAEREGDKDGDDSIISNSILYKSGISPEFYDISVISQTECASFISGSEAFKKFDEGFNETIKIPLIRFEMMKKYKKAADDYFDELFKHNQFNKLFVYRDRKDRGIVSEKAFYKNALMDMFKSESFKQFLDCDSEMIDNMLREDNEKIELLLEDDFPIEFRNSISFFERFDQMQTALTYYSDRKRITDPFIITKYYLNNNDNFQDDTEDGSFFTIENGTISASKWLKIALQAIGYEGLSGLFWTETQHRTWYKEILKGTIINIDGVKYVDDIWTWRIMGLTHKLFSKSDPDFIKNKSFRLQDSVFLKYQKKIDDELEHEVLFNPERTIPCITDYSVISYYSALSLVREDNYLDYLYLISVGQFITCRLRFVRHWGEIMKCWLRHSKRSDVGKRIALSAYCSWIYFGEDKPEEAFLLATQGANSDIIPSWKDDWIYDYSSYKSELSDVANISDEWKNECQKYCTNPGDSKINSIFDLFFNKGNKEINCNNNAFFAIFNVYGSLIARIFHNRYKLSIPQKYYLCLSCSDCITDCII